ncbi:MAG: cytochrome c3 family protein [Alphaproteobacteria bacterium]
MVTTGMNRNALRTMRGLLSAGWVLLLAASLTPATDAQAASGIANTKHNLGTAGTKENHLATGTGEICVFCHTPHGSDSSAAAPLWNKKVPDASSMTTYTSPTMFNSTTVTGNMSLACLSCHDGSQAMDTVLNAPGSGGYNASGATMGTWQGANQSAGKITGIAKIGTDLSNDHPVGMKYRNLTGETTGIGAEFKPMSGTNPLFYVESGISTGGGSASARDKFDLWLFPTFSGGSSDGVARVECATCHDPHTENATFLRVTNSTETGGTASGLCLTCHLK